ncbi:MAG: hypothetical protein EOM20_18350 [Spartobacteria bacterium]|nr:hypothetical protein [Spartobacteria bacterium]
MYLTEQLLKLFRSKRHEKKTDAGADSTENGSDEASETQLERAGISRELIDDICSGCCAHDHYCTLKEILIRVPRDARTLLQIKCIEKLKYERSVEQSRGVDWDEALDIWINEGYAARFADAYRDDIRLAELYPALHLKEDQASLPQES